MLGRDTMELVMIVFLEPQPESLVEILECDAFLEVVEDRHGISSTVVVTQFPIDRWHDNIKEATIADAILDRLVHNAHRIDLDGDSMRKLRSTLTKNRGSEKQETPASLRSDKTGRFPPERLDGYPRNRWTLSPEYAF